MLLNVVNTIVRFIRIQVIRIMKFIIVHSIHAVAVVPDDDFCDPLALEDPAGARTPPTPPVVPSPSDSPAPVRHRAMAHLRPVSIPALVTWPERIPHAKLLTLTDTTCLMGSPPLIPLPVGMQMITALS